MDFKPEKKVLSVSDMPTVITAQQSTSAEINLPDYCGDIKRILKCIIIPGINSVSVSGENITAAGVADIKLIYVSEKDKTDCYETQKDISVTAKCKDMGIDSIVSAKAKTNYVNCRATSQRRISVEGNIGVSFEIRAKSEKDILVSCEGKGVQLKKEKTAYENLICQREKIFDMGETVQLSADKGIVGKILRASAYAVLDSQKAVSDKLLIKGQLCTSVLYCTDSDEGKVAVFNHSMPISQIVDLQGVDENKHCSVRLCVRCLSVQRKSDSSSNGSFIEIGAKVAAMCKCSEKAEVYTATDCYSTSHEIKADYALEEFLCPLESINQQKTIKKTIDLPSSDIANITDIWCSEVTGDMKGKDNTATAQCSLTLCILFADSKGVPQYSEKNLDFTFDMMLKEKCEYLRCNMCCDVRSIDAALIGKDKIEVKIENGITTDIYSSQSKRILRNLEVIGEKNNADNAALTLYFPTVGEKVWDIARRYSTTAEAIKTENGIEGEEIEKESMLLIPAV